MESSETVYETCDPQLSSEQTISGLPGDFGRSLRGNTHAHSNFQQCATFNCVTGHQSGLSMSRQEINRLILEYLVVEGYKDAAERFSREIGFRTPLSELQSPAAGASLNDRMWIREAVLERRIEEVVTRVNQLWPELFDKNPFIYFQLRQLQMLELIRSRRLEEALTFAQSYLADPVAKRLSDHPQLLNEMQNTMALLAFEEPTDSIYGSLLGSRHAETVAGCLNRTILRHVELSGGCGNGSAKGMTGNQNTITSGEIARSLGNNVTQRRLSKETVAVTSTTGSSSSTIPRLTKMMAMLLHFRDLAQFNLPPELASL